MLGACRARTGGETCGNQGGGGEAWRTPCSAVPVNPVAAPDVLDSEPEPAGRFNSAWPCTEPAPPVRGVERPARAPPGTAREAQAPVAPVTAQGWASAIMCARDRPILSLFKRGHTPITPEMAEQAIDAHLVPLAAQLKPLEDCIGRTLRQDIADSCSGELLLAAGSVLGAPQIAALAAVGLAQVQVSRQPRIMVISTGDELIEPGEPIADHQVRRSNAYAIVAALMARGFVEVANDHLRDEERVLRERLARHLDERDVLVLSGGVSKGKLDLVPPVLKHLGVREVFYQVAQRPGMPMWFGAGPRSQAVFGLPGNPVATMVCLTRYVIPALAAAMGTRRAPPERIVLAQAVDLRRRMTSFLPVAIQHDSSARALALPRPTNGPGDFLALTRADGFIELPPRPEGFGAGFLATLHRW